MADNNVCWFGGVVEPSDPETGEDGDSTLDDFLDTTPYPDDDPEITTPGFGDGDGIPSYDM